MDIGASDAGSDGRLFGETDLKEAYGAGLHTSQQDNFGGFTEARRHAPGVFSSGNEN